QFILDNEDIYPGRIVRGELSEADIIAGYEGGPITSISTAYINIANTSLEAYDVQADYHWSTERYGDFHAYALATWQPHYRNQLLPDTSAIERVGFSGGMLEYRGNMGLTWARGPL